MGRIKINVPYFELYAILPDCLDNGIRFEINTVQDTFEHNVIDSITKPWFMYQWSTVMVF